MRDLLRKWWNSWSVISPAVLERSKYLLGRNYLKPLVKGDVVVAVDGKETVEEMLKLITTSSKFTLSIERRP